MAITNPFSITYGGRMVGGDSAYLLHGPYVFDKTHEGLRLVFDVVVTATSYEELHALATELENDFARRDATLVITIGVSAWTYEFGETLLNSFATLSKSGDSETDRGFSRAYTCVVEGGLPATDHNGLRELTVNVDLQSTRQRTVTFRGIYTALESKTASQQYLDEFDAEAATILAGIGDAATWELVAENYDQDRNDHTASFSRQYVELLADQLQGIRDATEIRDHQIRFTDLSNHPGDSMPEIHRLRHVVATYDCAIDIDQSTDPKNVFDAKVRHHIVALFESNFDPKVFCVEDARMSYDRTSNRMSVAIQFLYQSSESTDVIEVSQSFAYREVRTIDYTPVHDGDELAADADPGWAVLEYVATRTVIVVGVLAPKRRISSDSGGSVNRSGWNVIQNTSQVQQQWLGDPAMGEQVQVSILTETVVGRFNTKPDGGDPVIPEPSLIQDWERAPENRKGHMG